MEQTTPGDGVHDDRRLGWLVRQGREPLHTNAEWDAMLAAGHYGLDEERPTEWVFYVRMLGGGEVRWTNARFSRIPQNYHEQRWALDGKEAFKRARRCADCGAMMDAPPDAVWSQFDPETGACRNCHGLVNRPEGDG